MTEHAFITSCPSCKHEIRGIVNAGTRTEAPRPGDFSVCTECATICRFNNDMSLRVASYLEMVTDTNVLEYRALLDMRRAVLEERKHVAPSR